MLHQKKVQANVHLATLYLYSKFKITMEVMELTKTEFLLTFPIQKTALKENQDKFGQRF